MTIDIWAVVPVKSFAGAKQRLGPPREELERPHVLRESLDDMAAAERIGTDDLRRARDGALGSLGRRKLGHRRVRERQARCAGSPPREQH